MPKILIPVRLDPDIAAKLDEIVVSGVGDRSDHLRQAVSEYIARHGRMLPAQVSHSNSHLSIEGETDPLEPDFPLESPLRVA